MQIKKIRGDGKWLEETTKFTIHQTQFTRSFLEKTQLALLSWPSLSLLRKRFLQGQKSLKTQYTAVFPHFGHGGEAGERAESVARQATTQCRTACQRTGHTW